MFEKIKDFIKKTVHFLTYEIWRINGNGLSSKKINLYNFLKAFILAIRNIDGSNLNSRAAALTYNTLLSIVPLLAVLFAIARGFGLQNLVESELIRFFEGQQDVLKKAMTYVDNSLAYAQSGIFVGVGVILLLYTVLNLFSNIEDNFNSIWRIKKGRTYYRMFTDYLALFIVIPVFLICDAGLSILLSTTTDVMVIGWITSPIVKIVPFLIIIILFTFLFLYIPNTKVKFSAALFGGIVVGIAFQIFQMLYINGQIWISKYNAIYGSFAALPLLLLWIQLSWFICLFGVELSFAFQNVNKFSFEHETDNISRRYKDFVYLMVATLIVKRFEKGEKPYTADDLSARYKIPTQLTSEIIDSLEKIGIIVETPSPNDLIPAYLPAMDINKITVDYLFDKIDMYGSEDFIIDIEGEFKSEWDTILNIRHIINENGGALLLKDLG